MSSFYVPHIGILGLRQAGTGFLIRFAAGSRYSIVGAKWAPDIHWQVPSRQIGLRAVWRPPLSTSSKRHFFDFDFDFHGKTNTNVDNQTLLRLRNTSSWSWSIPKPLLYSCRWGRPQAWLPVRVLIFYLQATTHAHKLILLHERHIDTAQVYRNEVDVGKAIQQSGVKREDIFVSECSDRVWKSFVLVDWFKGCTNLFIFSLAILLSSTMLVWDIRGWLSTLRGGVEPIKAVCLERNLFALIVRLTVIDYTPLGFNLRSPLLPSARSRSSFLTY